MHYFQFNIGEYASHTRHLSPIEDIAYRRLLDLAYTTELPLVKDIRTLARLVNLREYQQEIVDVLNEFFFEVEDGWINNRVIKEIEKTGRKSAAARNSAAKRWDTERKANGKRTQCERNANASESDANAPKIDATNNPLPITNNPKANPLATPRARPARRCPDDFAITLELRQWARTWAPDVDIDAETEAFRDYEFAKGKTDWPATWRSWMRREQKSKPKAAPAKTIGLADQVMRNFDKNLQLGISHDRND